MSGDALAVEVQLGEELEAPPPLARLADAVRHALREEGVEHAELSLTLLGDAGIARINQEYLEHPGPTDVISFPLQVPGGPVVGDVYLGVEQARRQAAELGIPAEEELLRLAIHGTLHVLGYDHPEGEDREGTPMYRRQEELLESFLRAPRRP